MLIIDKRKDYYDYLSGIYGVDDKIVLDRRKYDVLPRRKGKVNLLICDWKWEGWYDGVRYYWGRDLELLGEVQKGKHNWKDKDTNREYVAVQSYVSNEIYSVDLKPMLTMKSPNRQQNCPILFTDMVENRYGYPTNIRYWRFPKLSDLDFTSVLPPMEIYLLLTEWLAPKENIEDNRSDTEKLKGHGFDNKTSFRKM